MDTERLYNRAIVLLTAIAYFIKEVESLNMTNEQFFIDFEMELNKWSVRDHNADSE